MLKKYKYIEFFYIIISVVFFYHTSYGVEDGLQDPLLDMSKRPSWTIDLSAASSSSQEQSIPMPMPGSGWEIQIPGSPQQQSALRFYPLSPGNLSDNENDTTWDRLDDFGHAIDATIFSPNQSRKVTALAILGAGAGLMVSSPACGYLMSSIADFLGVPLSSDVSKFLICWISISTAPVFTVILHEKSEAAGSRIFKRPSFTPTGRKLDSRPHVIKKNKGHRVLDGLVFCSASISAVVPTALMHVAEEQYPVFFYITAVPFYLTWLTTYFHETSWNLDQFFQKYFYLSEGTKYKKRILQEKIDHFKLAIRDYDGLADESFNYIQEAREKGFPTSSGEPFVFSGLFLKASNRADPAYSGGDAAQLLNFRMDMDNSRPSWKKDMLEWLNTYALGLATLAKFSITQHVLNDALLSLGLEDESAYIASASMSVFETAFRMLVMTSPPKKFFTEIPEFFSCNHINNCQIVRKIAGLVSGANAVLFSLPTVAAGLEVYHDHSTISKMAYLFPVFLNDVSFYNQLFNRGANKFITRILKAWKHDRESQTWMAQVSRRAALSDYADKVSEFIENADLETIEQLYSLLQEGT